MCVVSSLISGKSYTTAHPEQSRFSIPSVDLFLLFLYCSLAITWFSTCWTPRTAHMPLNSVAEAENSLNDYLCNCFTTCLKTLALVHYMPACLVTEEPPGLHKHYGATGVRHPGPSVSRNPSHWQARCTHRYRHTQAP